MTFRELGAKIDKESNELWEGILNLDIFTGVITVFVIIFVLCVINYTNDEDIYY